MTSRMTYRTMPTVVSRASMAPCFSAWSRVEDAASGLLDSLLIKYLLLLLFWQGKQMIWCLHRLLYPGEFLLKAQLAEGQHCQQRCSVGFIGLPRAQAGKVR